MSLIYYLLEANLYLLLFYGFYRLFLEKETFYMLNRYYLIVASAVSFIVPFLQASYFNNQVITERVERLPGVLVVKNASELTLTPVSASQTFASILSYIYIAITVLFIIKLSLSIFSIIKIVLRSKKEKAGKITFVLLGAQDEKAYSFFNLLFINPALEERQTVIKHEMVHINQHHSMDILFFELIQVVSWFNPVAYLLKKEIKIIHEYLADESTTSLSNNKHEYAMFLIRNSFGIPSNELTNHIFNQSILKRRINMLNKERTTAKARLRLLLLVPLGGIMVCMSTMAFTKDYGLIDLYPEKYSAVTPAGASDPNNEIPPPPVEIERTPNGKYRFNAKYVIDEKTNKPRLSTDYLIVINGKSIDKTDISAIWNANKMTIIGTVEGIKKYGQEGKNGVLEVTGTDVKVSKGSVVPPPPPIDQEPVKTDKVKFPPAVVTKNDAHNFFSYWRFNRTTKKSYRPDTRLVLVNGKVFDGNAKGSQDIVGFKKATNIVYLSAAEAVKKYGDKAKTGAVEISGDQMDIVKLSPPPLPKMQANFKYPPPVVKPDKKTVKVDVVKFPPPVVIPDKKTSKKNIKLPPPVVIPDKKTSEKNIKLPPPVVTPDKKAATVEKTNFIPVASKINGSRKVEILKRKSIV